MSARQFTTYSEFLGYSTVSDETNSDPRILQQPSQNVYVDWNSAIRQRKGIVLCGADGSVSNGGIKGTYTFRTPRGVTHSLRIKNGVDSKIVQRLVKTVVGGITTWSWDTVGSIFTLSGGNDFVTFAEVNDIDLAKTFLIFGVGNQYINYWDGTYGRVLAETIGTTDRITVEGTQSLVDLGFTMPPSGSVTLGFVGSASGSFSYTGFAPSDTTIKSIGACTFDLGTDTVTQNRHRLGSNTPIQFTTTGTLPTGITEATQYFAVEVTTNTFKVASTPNGAPIDLTGSSSGTHTLSRFTGLLDSFAGVTVLSGTIDVGDRIYSGILGQVNSSMNFPADYTIDYVGMYRNQLYLGSNKSRVIRVSSATAKGSFDFSFVNFATSLDVGGARTLTIDDTCGGFEPTKDGMVIYGSTDSIFKRSVIVSSDQTKEFSEITRLETAPRQGLASPLGKLNIKNALVNLTNEKTLDTLSFVENISELQTTPISDIVKLDFENTNFTNASLFYFERNLFVLAPASAVIFWYDLQRKLWQAPIKFSQEVMGMMSVTEDGQLLIHSAQKDTSYFLFQGDNDNGVAIQSKATFAYNHFGDRYRTKNVGVCVQDGYISANGQLKRTLEYGFKGSKGSYQMTFNGGNTDFLYYQRDDGGLGKAALGQRTLGGNSIVSVTPERRFLFADDFTNIDFYMLRATYEMETADATWSLVSYGMDAGLTETDVNSILLPSTNSV